MNPFSFPFSCQKAFYCPGEYYQVRFSYFVKVVFTKVLLRVALHVGDGDRYLCTANLLIKQMKLSALSVIN